MIYHIYIYILHISHISHLAQGSSLFTIRALFFLFTGSFPMAELPATQHFEIGSTGEVEVLQMAITQTLVGEELIGDPNQANAPTLPDTAGIQEIVGAQQGETSVGEPLFPATSEPTSLDAHVPDQAEHTPNVSELYGRITQLRNEGDKLKVELNNLSNTLAIERSSNKRLVANFKEKEESFATTLTSLKHQNLELNDALKRSQKEYTHASLELGQYKAERDALNLKLQEVQVKLASSEEDKKMMANVNMALKQQSNVEKTKCLKLEKEVEKLHQDLKDRDATMSALYEKATLLENQVENQGKSQFGLSSKETEDLLGEQWCKFRTFMTGTMICSRRKTMS